jgi:hypothetical protein
LNAWWADFPGLKSIEKNLLLSQRIMTAIRALPHAFWASVAIAQQFRRAIKAPPTKLVRAMLPQFVRRFTPRLSLAEIHRLTVLLSQPRNLQPRCGIALTTPMRFFSLPQGA